MPKQPHALAPPQHTPKEPNTQENTRTGLKYKPIFTKKN